MTADDGEEGELMTPGPFKRSEMNKMQALGLRAGHLSERSSVAKRTKRKSGKFRAGSRNRGDWSQLKGQGGFSLLS